MNGARRPDCLLYSRSGCARNASALWVVRKPTNALYSPFVADTEKRRADADFSRAFFDCDFEVVAHAHGKRWHGSSKAPAELIAQFAQLPEMRARLVAVVGVWRNREQAVQVEMRES